MAQPPVLRGEVHWVDLSPAEGSERGGVRPVLVLQDDTRSGTTSGLAITSQPQRPGYPLALSLESGEGDLPKPSWIEGSRKGQRPTLNDLPKPSWIEVTQIRTSAL